MQVLLVSGDDVDTLRRFRAEKGAGLDFVADPEAALIARYQAKMPIFAVAKRVTFVIGQDRRIAAVFTGDAAIDARQALVAAAALVPNPGPGATSQAASQPASRPSSP